MVYGSYIDFQSQTVIKRSEAVDCYAETSLKLVDNLFVFISVFASLFWNYCEMTTHVLRLMIV